MWGCMRAVWRGCKRKVGPSAACLNCEVVGGGLSSGGRLLQLLERVHSGTEWTTAADAGMDNEERGDALVDACDLLLERVVRLQCCGAAMQCCGGCVATGGEGGGRG